MTAGDTFRSWSVRRGFDRERVRAMTVDANDGIIATAGIVEGFSGAGATLTTLIIAAVSAMIAGTIALAGAKYAEAAGDRDAELALMEEERRQLALSPAEEFDELVEHYRGRGLTPELARQVAGELTARDALSAHLRAEHGWSEADITKPGTVAVIAGISFAIGSGVPLAAILVAPEDARAIWTIVIVALALVVTSVVAARSGRVSVARTVGRSLAIGVGTMLLTLGAGYLIAF
ncbi:VIT family protein [Microlunatus ginsengisoli]|uniref:VIT family protein n=1 Tax=Microlunatus ginsengisoli TaxID=363863 RepID=A0ABP6ZQK6_9ACTN